MRTKHTLIAGLLALAACFTTATQAAAPVITGNLGSGTFAGSVTAESGPLSGAENWSFWTFSVDFLSDFSITVTPQSSDFDPIIGVWYGVEADTAHYIDLQSDGFTTLFVAGADGTPSNPLAGAGEAASLSFTNTYGNGQFVLAIADYTDGVGSGNLAYSISAVPEPASLLQLTLGLACLAGLARSRRT